MSPRLSIDIEATARAVASVQMQDGAIPHETGSALDPWNHVEAAMALDCGRLHREAERAYEWLRRSQRGDGSWAMSYRAGAIEDAAADANFCAYVAAGVWHHHLATGDTAFLARMWPAVDAAIEFVLELQTGSGAIHWARDAQGAAWPAALRTSCSCIHLSLAAAIRAALTLGHQRPAWENARAALGIALRERPEAFEPRDRYAMDWYYPVLSGALPPAAAGERLRRGWDAFVVEGWGVRCVSDRPWITMAETAELVLALDVAGRPDDAARVLSWTARLRDEDGSYWTGVTFDTNQTWPEERPTWTSGAVVLAACALEGTSPVASFFRDLAADDEPAELEAS